jgi:hypothetical protein
MMNVQHLSSEQTTTTNIQFPHHQITPAQYTYAGCVQVLETMPEGRIRKEGLGLSSYAVPLTRVRAPHFRMKSRTHPMKFS